MEPSKQQFEAEEDLRVEAESPMFELGDTLSMGTPSTGGPATPMQLKRFLFGMLIATGGIALMLIVAFGLLQGWGIHKDLSLPAIGLLMILGLMMLGGGFGVMATAAGTFDDDEFDRLMAGEKRPLDDGQDQRNAEFSRIQKTSPIGSRQANRQAGEHLQSS